MLPSSLHGGYAVDFHQVARKLRSDRSSSRQAAAEAIRVHGVECWEVDKLVQEDAALKDVIQSRARRPEYLGQIVEYRRCLLSHVAVDDLAVADRRLA